MRIRKRYSIPPDMPVHFLENGLLVKQQCEYIGSLQVPFLKGCQRENYINDKLMGFGNVRFGLNVVLVITLHGVKTYREERVKLGHSITHVMFTSFFPKKYLFAYVTKSYSLNQVIQCQAHVYKLSRSKHYNHLNKAFEKALKHSKHQHHHIDPPLKPLTNVQKQKAWLKSESYDTLDHVQKNNDQIKKLLDDDAKQSPVNKKESFDLSEYIIIEDQFMIENEYYNPDLLIHKKDAGNGDKLNIINEYYTPDCTKLDAVKLPGRWLLPRGTPMKVVEKELHDKFIGSYLVVPSETRDTYYTLHLRVPHHIHVAGLLSCTIKEETDKGFHLQGCLPYFKSLSELVHHYGSIHNSIEGSTDQVDHGHNDRLVLEDYECYESVSIMMSELDAYRKIFG